MILRSVLLQHFRSYTQQKFDFDRGVTVIIGPNTAGKTNLSEAIYLLATGKSFRTSTDSQMIAFGQEVGRVGGILEEPEMSNVKFQISNSSDVISSEARDLPNSNEEISHLVEIDKSDITKVEVVLVSESANGGRFSKKFFINGVARSRAALRDFLPIVLFRPEELDIVIDSPSVRREFLDSALEQTDKQYAQAILMYQKALRQRNALLDIARETGSRNTEQFDYWDSLLIEHGTTITQKREEFISYLNSSYKEIFPVTVVYDHSKISQERLVQYKEAEIGAGSTLVGPHRDDFFTTMDVEGSAHNIKYFGSRGQQRLVILQLKLLQISYMKEKMDMLPVLVLDDIFSELDSSHIQLILEKVKGCQVILTTTHREFIPQSFQDKSKVIMVQHTG